MNVEISTEAAQSTGKEYKNGIFFAVQVLASQCCSIFLIPFLFLFCTSSSSLLVRQYATPNRQGLSLSLLRFSVQKITWLDWSTGPMKSTLYVAFAKNNFTYWHPEKGPYQKRHTPIMLSSSMATKLPSPLLVSFAGRLSPNSERDPIVS